MQKVLQSSLFQFIIVLVLILSLVALGPQVKFLGSNVRLVYLHGAWVLTAEVAFLAAALTGLAALLARKPSLHTWSRALGLTGTLFWVTYLPLSLLAMQTNWNGLFLAEPRFRLALIFAVTAVLLQIGLWLFNLSWLTSTSNLVFFIAMRVAFSTTTNIMHPPPSPIFNSGDWRLISYFVGLNLLTWVAAWVVCLSLIKIISKNHP